MRKNAGKSGSVSITIEAKLYNAFSRHARDHGFSVKRAVEIILTNAMKTDELQRDVDRFINSPTENPRHHDLQKDLVRSEIKELVEPAQVIALSPPTGDSFDIGDVLNEK